MDKKAEAKLLLERAFGQLTQAATLASEMERRAATLRSETANLALKIDKYLRQLEGFSDAGT